MRMQARGGANRSKDGATRGSSGPPHRRDGDPTSFEELYAASRVQVERLAFLMVGDSAVASDLAHEAFVGLLRRWDDVENPSAYVRRSVTNAARSHITSLGRERAKVARLERQRVDRSDELEYLADAIQALPFRQRAVVILKFYGDLPEKEVAAAIGIRPGSVGPTLHRALRTLRKDMSDGR